MTGLYTIAPYRRTPPEVVAALWQDPDRQEPAPRPRPVDQAVRATREGQAVALTRLAERVAPCDGPPIQPRVARTDGAAALQQPVVTPMPQHTLVRDIIPAPESLGDTANARLGETHPPRLAWVRAVLEPLLVGQTEAVITALAVEANDPTCTMRHRQAVRRPVGYDHRNRP